MGRDKIPSGDVCLKYIFWVRTEWDRKDHPLETTVFPLTKGAKVTSFDLLPKI